MTVRPVIVGAAATLLLAALYGAVVSALSGWTSMLNQFRQYWYFLLALWLGFGFQVGLYAHARQVARALSASGTALAVTGTSSTAAMLSCCVHYLTGLLPILGTSGFASFVSQYQPQLFWVSIALNAAGIAYLLHRITAQRHHLRVMTQTT